MARIRSIKPGYFTSLDTAGCLHRDTRLHFAGLWTYADDAGRAVDDPRLIKAAVWPLDDGIDTYAIEDMQDELEKAGRIVRYIVDERRYFQVLGWHEHQHPNRPIPSKIPPYDPPYDPTHGARTEHAVSPQSARTEDSSPEWRGEGEEEEKETKPFSSPDGDADDGFEHFWAVWPKRNGKKLAKDKAHRAWSRLTLPARRDAYRGAVNYAAASDAGLAGGKDAFRWLQGREWPDWQTPAEPNGRGDAPRGVVIDGEVVPI